MERELWKRIMNGIHSAARSRKAGARFTYDTAGIVRVYLWAVLHDRPVLWACQSPNWPRECRPTKLPSQSTMSRRLRTQSVKDFLNAVTEAVGGPRRQGLLYLLDGKPLVVSRHSQDKDARFGRGAGGQDRGYKLHALWGKRAIPEAFSVTPLNVSEPLSATGLVARLENPAGYILADANYDSSDLHEAVARRGCQLLAPRRRPGTGRGHHFQSRYRLRALDMLEGPSRFGRSLFRQRRGIESRFGWLTGFGGGLQGLPSWVRGLRRVTLYVHGKLIINAAMQYRRRIGA